MHEQSKECTICEEIKPLSEYYRAGKNRTTWRSECKLCCHRRVRKIMRKKRNVRSNQMRAAGYILHGEHTDLKTQAHKWRQNYTRHGEGFDREWYTVERLVHMMLDNEYCPLCGVEIAYSVQETAGLKNRRPMLVRPDKSRGFARSNIAIICRGCRYWSPAESPVAVVKWRERVNELMHLYDADRCG